MATVARLVLTGSESTGKTTLARALAAHYHTSWVPEFARGYAEQRKGLLTAADVEPIAWGQLAAEDAAEGKGGVVVLDTDLLSTIVYARHYYEVVPSWLETALGGSPPSFYLLCDIDLPWVADGVRDRGDEREKIHRLFRKALEKRDLPFELVTGTGPARLTAAVAAADRWLGRKPEPKART